MPTSTGSDDAHLGLSFLLKVMGRFDEALREAKYAQQLAPLDAGYRMVVGEHLNDARRYDEAIEECQIALDMDPNFQLAYFFLTLIYENKGMYQEAAVTWYKRQILLGASEEEAGGLSDAFERSGEEGYWRQKLDYFKDRAQQGMFVTPTNFARIHARLGEEEQALEWLEKAYETREGTMWNLKVSPKYDLIRDDPRFQDLLRRMNLEP